MATTQQLQDSVTDTDGLNDETYGDEEGGDLGDGSGNSSDWLKSALSYVKEGSEAASSVIGLFNGGKAAVSSSQAVNTVQPISNTAGPVSKQNTVGGFSLSTIPVWGWIVGGFVFLGGLIFALKK